MKSITHLVAYPASRSRAPAFRSRLSGYLRSTFFPLALVSAAALLPGCKVIGGIFKAGIWVGVIVAVAVVAMIVGAVRYFR